MQTDEIYAWQLDEGDYITLGSDEAYRVEEFEDTGDGINLTLSNDDGDLETFSFTPDDEIHLVVKWDEDNLETLLEDPAE